MAVKMRLRREGKKKQPYYRVVVADVRAPRDGGFIDDLGFYQPLHDPSTISIDRERALKWLRDGAQPTSAVLNLLRIEGIWEEFRPGDPGRDRSAQHAAKAAKAAEREAKAREEVEASRRKHQEAQAAAAAQAAADAAPAAEDTAPAAEDTAPAAEDTASAAEDTAPAAEEAGDSTEAAETAGDAVEAADAASGEQGVQEVTQPDAQPSGDTAARPAEDDTQPAPPAAVEGPADADETTEKEQS